MDSPIDIAMFVVGLIAAICIAIFSAPQLFRVLKTKDTASVPLVMYAILTFGSLCFVIQGIVNLSLYADTMLLSVLPVTIANCFSLLFAGSVLTIKIAHIIKAKKANITEKQYCEDLAKKCQAKKA